MEQERDESLYSPVDSEVAFRRNRGYEMDYDCGISPEGTPAPSVTRESPYPSPRHASTPDQGTVLGQFANQTLGETPNSVVGVSPRQNTVNKESSGGAGFDLNPGGWPRARSNPAAPHAESSTSPHHRREPDNLSMQIQRSQQEKVADSEQLADLPDQWQSASLAIAKAVTGVLQELWSQMGCLRSRQSPARVPDPQIGRAHV